MHHVHFRIDTHPPVTGGCVLSFLATVDLLDLSLYNTREMSGRLSKFLIKQAAGAGLVRGLGKLIPRPVASAGRWVKNNPIKSVLGAGALGVGGYAMMGGRDGGGSGMDLSGLLPALGGLLGRGGGDQQQQPVVIDRNPVNATLPKPPSAQPDYGTAAYDTADGLRHLYGMRRSLTPQFDPGAAMPYNPEAR